MTKHLPSAILDIPIFQTTFQYLMKGNTGVYALYDGDNPYYVGLTTNLFGSVNHHLRDRHEDEWDLLGSSESRR
jgi:hypothetical protein